MGKFKEKPDGLVLEQGHTSTRYVALITTSKIVTRSDLITPRGLGTMWA